ncbi:hypothetical protein ACOMHN_014247 [Nucella lapillus]
MKWIYLFRKCIMYFLQVKRFRESAIIRAIHPARQKKGERSCAHGSSASGGVLLRHILDDICWLKNNACEKCLIAQPAITEHMNQIAISIEFSSDDKLRWCLQRLEFYAASLVLQSGGTMDKFHDILESLVTSYIDDESVVRFLEAENSFVDSREMERAQYAYTPGLKNEDKYEAK